MSFLFLSFLVFYNAKKKSKRGTIYETAIDSHCMHVYPHFFLTDRRSSDTVSFLRGLDVNNTPVPARECDEDNGASSPNSTVSSLSGKRRERSEPMAAGEEEAEEGERDSCSRGSDDDEGGAGDNSRKKLRLTKEQSLVLEETFKDHNTLNPVSSPRGYSSKFYVEKG